MFERFTEGARRSLFYARARAAGRDGDALSSEDLLAGIGLAARDALIRVVGDPGDLIPRETGEEFLARLTRDRAAWTARAAKEIPFTAEAQAALERAIQASQDLGHSHVRPEHLLFGILSNPDSDAARRLRAAGATLAGIDRVLREQAGPTGGAEPGPGGL